MARILLLMRKSPAWRAQSALCGLLGFCSLALAQAPSEPDFRFAHPDAGAKISLNLQALLNSPAIAKAIQDGKSQAKDNAMQVELVLAMLKSVERVSVSVRQNAGAAASANPDVLVQVTGSFDPQMIAGFFPSTGTSKVKIVGPHTILIGEGDSFAAAAARMTSAAPRPVDELERSDIWFSASSGFLAQMAAGPASSAGAVPPALQGLQGMSMGLNVGDAPEINVLLRTTDAAAASEMLKTFQVGTEQLALMNPMAGQAMKALSMQQDGSRIRVHFVVPPEMVALAQQQAASGGLPAQLAPMLGNFGLGGSSKRPGTATPEPPPQNGGKVVIYGLDGGPKTIPLKQ